jgi:hypothetical protein
MKYLLLMCIEEPPADAAPAADTDDAETAQDDAAADDGVPAIETWLAETGSRRLLGSPLVTPDRAVTVRTRNGEVLLADGPYAETKEWIGGFDVIEAASTEEAIEIASRHPVAHFGMVEVRQFTSYQD